MKLSYTFNEVDAIDKEILLLFTKEHNTSSYSVWSAMAKGSREKQDQDHKISNSYKVLAYKNIYKRTLQLEKAGFLKKIQSDYKLTLKGLEQLTCYILSHPEELENFVQYMNQHKLDKKAFGNLISERALAMIESTNLYLGSTTYLETLPMDMIQIKRLRETALEFNFRLDQLTKQKIELKSSPQGSNVIEAQRAAEIAAGIDSDKEILKKLEQMNLYPSKDRKTWYYKGDIETLVKKDRNRESTKKIKPKSDT